MTLETAISDLAKANDALTQTVFDNLKKIDDFIGRWSVEQPTVLTVGTGCAYDSLQAAWDALQGKRLLAPVTIKLSDGIYEGPTLIAHHPDAHNIRIEGNLTNPEACQFTWDNPKQDSQVLRLCNVRGLTLDGIHIKGPDKSNAGYGLVLEQYSHLLSGQALRIDNWYFGLHVLRQSCFNGQDVCFHHCTRSVYAASAQIELTGGEIHGDEVDSPESLGVCSDRNSYVVTIDTQIDGFAAGFYAAMASSLFCHRTTSTNCGVGYQACNNGQIYGEDIVAEQTQTALLAINRGLIIAPKATVHEANVGCEAYLSSTIYANESNMTDIQDTAYLATVDSLIEAQDTNVRCSSVATPYSPPVSGISNNEQAIIRWS